MTAPVFVIGLKRATGRAKLVKQELAKAGLVGSWINAIDCVDVTREELLRDCRAEGPWGYFQTKDMACTLSHSKAWEAVIDSKAEVALILEDDVFLSPEMKSWMADLSWWPENAGLVRFESWRSNSLRVALGRHPQEYLNRKVHRLRSRNPGGAAYAITRSAAQHFLAQKPYDITLDNYLFNPSASSAAKQIAAYQVQPAMVEQGNEAPGEVGMGPPRYRPKGWVLFRQKIRRGLCELSSGLRVALHLLLGQASLERVYFEPNVLPTKDLHTQNFK